MKKAFLIIATILTEVGIGCVVYQGFVRYLQILLARAVQIQ